MIHLDTGFLIQALVPASRVDKCLRRMLAEEETLAVSAVAWTEFLCGPVGSRSLEKAAGLLKEIAPYTSADCETAARLFNVSGRRRGTLADCMIAAVAMRSGAALATTNPKDFERFDIALPLVVP